MLALGQVTILFGVLKYTRFYGLDNILGIIHILLWAGLAIMGEVIYQLTKNRKDDFIDLDKSITIDEFRERVKGGEQLVILDDMVLNVANFLTNHPGGRFVL